MTFRTNCFRASARELAGSHRERDTKHRATKLQETRNGTFAGGLFSAFMQHFARKRRLVELPRTSQELLMSEPPTAPDERDHFPLQVTRRVGKLVTNPSTGWEHPGWRGAGAVCSPSAAWLSNQLIPDNQLKFTVPAHFPGTSTTSCPRAPAAAQRQTGKSRCCLSTFTLFSGRAQRAAGQQWGRHSAGDRHHHANSSSKPSGLALHVG